MTKTMFAIYSNELYRDIKRDEYEFGLDSENVLDTVMNESNADYLEGLYPTIQEAREAFKSYECDIYSIIEYGRFFSAKVFWIEEVNVNDSNRIIEALGTWDYMAADLFPVYDD